MSSRTIVAVFLLVVFCFATDVFAASAGVKRMRSRKGNSADSYNGGEGDSVKTAKSEDFVKVKDSQKPLCVYIYDSDANNNTKAKLFEGADGLGNADVREKLKGFAFHKIKADGTDGKGWPDEWRQRARNAAALVILSSDRRHLFILDKETPREQITPEAISNALGSITRYEESQKKAEEALKKNQK